MKDLVIKPIVPTERDRDLQKMLEDNAARCQKFLQSLWIPAEMLGLEPKNGIPPKEKS